MSKGITVQIKGSLNKVMKKSNFKKLENSLDNLTFISSVWFLRKYIFHKIIQILTKELVT